MSITKGAWEFYSILPQEEAPPKFEIVQSETEETVAIVEGHDNAQAIAAVPEMVAALKLSVEGWNGIAERFWPKHVRPAMAAIAKAEGRE